MFRIVATALALMAVVAALGFLVAVAAGLIWTPNGDDIARVDPHVVFQFAAALI